MLNTNTPEEQKRIEFIKNCFTHNHEYTLKLEDTLKYVCKVFADNVEPIESFVVELSPKMAGLNYFSFYYRINGKYTIADM